MPPDLYDEALERELEQNRAAYTLLKDRIRKDCAGQYVVLAFGRLIGTAPTYGEAIRLVLRLQPAPLSVEVFLAEHEPLFDAIQPIHKEFV